METDLESWARKEIAKAGGLMLKWTSPGTRGVPDDIVFWPEWPLHARNVIHFIEFKWLKGRASKLQDEMRTKLQDLGCNIFYLNTKVQVRQYIKNYATP